jgi:hypothetical protein
MPRDRISVSVGYALCNEAWSNPWDQDRFDRVERKLLRFLPKGQLSTIHSDNLYFAGRFYFMAWSESKQHKYYKLAKRYFAAASDAAGDITMGTILDWQSWLLAEGGTPRERVGANKLLWRIIEMADIEDAAEAAATLAIISKRPRLKAKATAAALALYEKICKDLRSDLEMYTDDTEFEERVRANSSRRRSRSYKKQNRRSSQRRN